MQPVVKIQPSKDAETASDPMVKREQFAVSLRTKKRQQIIKRKRQCLLNSKESCFAEYEGYWVDRES